jgi:Tfp pilus assembly protein PilF/4-amino-4-deoxy-L-arabinose transferase-like glycosyltransferase
MTNPNGGRRSPKQTPSKNPGTNAPTPMPRGRRREWITLGLILLVGLALRMAYLGEIKDSPAFRYPAYDAAFNDYWARSLATGDWSAPKFYSDPRIRETAFFRPPGYPYFLSAVYFATRGSYAAARIVQMLLGLASCVLAYLFARGLFGGRVGLVFAGLMSVYWLFIYFEGELQAPVLMVFLTLATLAVLARWIHRATYRNTIAAGILLGLLGLVMPNTLVLAPVALVWVWWLGRRRKDGRLFRKALVGFSMGLVVAIAPATIRNYAVSGDPVLITSNAGINFYIGNNEYTDCVTANAPILGQYTGLGSWTCFDEPAITEAVEKITGRRLKSSEVSRYFTDKALAHIGAHPGKTLELMGRKALLFWGPAEVSNNEVLQYDRAESRLLPFLPGFPVALALAIVGFLLLVIELRRPDAGKTKPAGTPLRRFEFVVLATAFVAVYFASYLPFFIQGRYRIPVVPVLLLFGAYGIDRAGARFAARRFKSVALWVGVFVVAYLGARVQLADYRSDLGMWHFLRGDAYRKQGKTELARAEFSKAVESSAKPNAVAYNNLGVALDQLGRQADSVEPFEKAIEINPNFLDARRNLVSVLLKMKRAEPAYEQLREIVRIDPADAVAHSNLGVCLLMQSRLDDAASEFEKAVELNPGYVNARYYLARTLAQMGKRDEAMAQLQRVLDLKPDHPGARAMMEEITSGEGIPK